MKYLKILSVLFASLILSSCSNNEHERLDLELENELRSSLMNGDYSAYDSLNVYFEEYLDKNFPEQKNFSSQLRVFADSQSSDQFPNPPLSIEDRHRRLSKELHEVNYITEDELLNPFIIKEGIQSLEFDKNSSSKYVEKLNDVVLLADSGTYYNSSISLTVQSAAEVDDELITTALVRWFIIEGFAANFFDHEKYRRLMEERQGEARKSISERSSDKNTAPN